MCRSNFYETGIYSCQLEVKNTFKYMYKLIDIAAKYDTDVLFNIVSPVGRAKDNSEILTDTERIDMNLKILNYMLGKGMRTKRLLEVSTREFR